jgi:TonB family protein
MATPSPYYRGFQLGLLPERRMSWQTLATSYGIECIFILIVLNIGLLFPDKIQVRQNYHITEIIPIPSNQPKPLPIKPKPQPQVHAKLLPAVPVEKPHLIVPKEVRAPQPKPVEPEAPQIALDKFKAPEIKPIAGGARPQLIHTGDFSTGSSATPTVNAPVQKVQTGGFGDPNGVKGDGKANAKLMIASTGSFDMPQGAGQGNGTGGTKGIKGTVASAGFGNGVATGGVGDGRSNGRGVATGGFGQQEVSQGVAKPRQLDQGPPTTPVEITFKPNPLYTPEARSLKLEGEVLLEVMFGANGQLHVNRVVRGLGHGLDEAAIDAANKMRFKPALRNGQPVDSTAVVHVVFQLAY